MKKAFAGLCLLILPILTQAQEKYWQQEVNYQINVSLDDKQHKITADQTIEYINNSPDALDFIYIHLWPNAYKNTKTAFAKQQLLNKNVKFYFAPDSARGYIDGLDFRVNGQPVKLEYDPEHIDIAKLILNQPLPSGQHITITTPFTVKLPDSFSRLGHVDQSYQITQWYPKPAVYDHKGWHPMPYLDQGEFYSEFGKFDVSITLPKNYVVGATGVLQTESEIAFMNKLAAASESRKDFGNYMGFPPSDTATKTIRYVQDKVHDFAWFADKRYNVVKSSVELPHSGRNVTTWLLFTNKDAGKWMKSVKDINDAVYYYSKWVGDYPYDHCTAVDGALSAGGGMEYPMVTVTMPEAIIHEVGHNWFYGILASNERKHPWMDEGINSYIETRIQTLDDPKGGNYGGFLKSSAAKKLNLDELNTNAVTNVAYQIAGSHNLDQPMELESDKYRSFNYAGIVYMKSTVAFNYLAGYLGQERFDACMLAYYDRWKFKHPYPEDIEAVFEEVSGENLDWFFKNVVGTDKPIKVSLTDAAGSSVTVKNKTGFPVPVEVAALDAEGKVLETKWTKPFEGEQTVSFNTANAHSYLIDPDYRMPEINKRDNRINTTGILRKWEPLRLNPIAGIEQPHISQLYYLPVVGANTTDKFMLGVALYNSSAIQKRINYFLMPMFSFNRTDLKGTGDVNVILLQKDFIRQAKVGVYGQRFAEYEKLQPYLEIALGQESRTSPQHNFKVAFTKIDDFRYSSDNKTRLFTNGLNALSTWYTVSRGNAVRKISFELENHSYWLKPLGEGNIQSRNASQTKAALTYEQKYTRNKKFNIRVFGGGNFAKDEANSPIVIGLSGSPDYLKETAFLDRAQISNIYTGFVHQTDNRDGAFKSYIPVSTKKWMTAVNLMAEIPKLPLGVFADAGTFQEADKLYWDSGLYFSLANGLFSMYFPVAGSNYTDTLPNGFKNFRNNIRFDLRLRMQNLNPNNLVDRALSNSN